MRGFYCGDRFCKPCSRARAARGRRAIALLAGRESLRFITLTIATGSRNCTDALNHLLKSFRALRRSDIWTQNVKGGVAVVEAKIGDGSGEWHVHLHCLCTGSYVAQRALSQAWHAATGDSFIVDVRAVKDQEVGLNYVCKYLGKGFDQSVLASPDHLRECINALSGRRLLTAFGDWYGRLTDVEADEVGEWRVVGSLDGIVRQALRGDEWARGVLLCVHGRFQRGGLKETVPDPWWFRIPQAVRDAAVP